MSVEFPETRSSVEAMEYLIFSNLDCNIIAELVGAHKRIVERADTVRAQSEGDERHRYARFFVSCSVITCRVQLSNFSSLLLWQIPHSFL